MLHVYINYPNPLISVHRDHSCAQIGKNAKTDQRRVRLQPSTISAEILKFRDREYQFSSDSLHNDIWLEIDFNNARFEEEVLKYVQVLIGKHYRPLQTVAIKEHCTLNG